MLKKLMIGAGFAAALTGTAYAEITGAGSTFVYPILSKWSGDYSAAGGEKINYQSIGSGGGIAQIKAGTVTFGASDKPLSPQELDAAGLGQFPVVIGGVVPVVHIDGIRPGQLHFSGQLLAQIFAGEIKMWNDPKIAALNPGTRLPAAAITVVHRSDGSGTTFNWVHYLSQISPTWRAKVGEGTSVQWPVGIGGKGNEGVAAYVNQVKNSIGYVEYAYVVQNHMTYGAVQNSAGKFIQPNGRSFQAAANHADWAHAKDFYLVITDAPGADSYPITATTFAIMYKHPKNPAQSAAAIKFFRWALEHGQQQAINLQYVPLPAALVKQIEGYMAATIK
jgi:phosphate transport system substrate-binding protein